VPPDFKNEGVAGRKARREGAGGLRRIRLGKDVDSA